MTYGYAGVLRTRITPDHPVPGTSRRQVFPNHMVAHVWAQQTHERGRSHNGNLHFNGHTLYSYAEPIGQFLTGVDGQPVVLLSNRNWSITTSQHQSMAHNAVRGQPRIVYGYSLSYSNVAPDHTDNLARHVAAFNDYVAKMRRMRDPSEWLLAHLWETATQYAIAFGLDRTSIPSLKETTAAIQAFHTEREARLNTPEHAAKRERARARREALRDEREARQREQARLEADEALGRWRMGGRVYLPDGANTDDNGGALLRIIGNRLETSQGAEVPLVHAIAVFRRAKRCRDAGVGWHRNGATVRVGHFQLDSIGADGSIRAGCHLINWPEIEAAARVAGVL